MSRHELKIRIKFPFERQKCTIHVEKVFYETCRYNNEIFAKVTNRSLSQIRTIWEQRTFELFSINL